MIIRALAGPSYTLPDSPDTSPTRSFLLLSAGRGAVELTDVAITGGKR